MAYMWGTQSMFGRSYQPQNMYSGNSPWYGGAGASATDPSSIPGYRGPYQSGGAGIQGPNSYPMAQQNPYNQFAQQPQQQTQVAAIAPLMVVPQPQPIAYAQPQQPVYQQPGYQQPVFNQPAAPVVQRNIFGRTPEEESTYQMQQARQAQDQAAAMQAQFEQQRLAWEQQERDRQAAYQAERMRVEQARLAWEQQERDRIAQQQAQWEAQQRAAAEQRAAEEAAYQARGAQAENDWYGRESQKRSDYANAFNVWKQQIEGMPEPDWNALPVFQMLRGAQPAASFQARGQAAEQALKGPDLPVMPAAPPGMENLPQFIGRNTPPEILQKAQQLRQMWNDQVQEYAKGGPKPKPIKLNLPQAHQVNYQTYANLLPSEKALLDSGIKSQGQRPEDWVEMLRRSMPAGRGVGRIGWG